MQIPVFQVFSMGSTYALFGLLIWKNSLANFLYFGSATPKATHTWEKIKQQSALFSQFLYQMKNTSEVDEVIFSFTAMFLIFFSKPLKCNIS